MKMFVDQSETKQEPGRAGLILAFGIIAIISFGPFFGIPAWVMGRTDMRKIRAGIIPQSEKGMTQAGLIIGAVGTFFSPFTIVLAGIVIAIGLSINTAQEVAKNRDAVISQMTYLAQLAKEHKQTNQTYRGFKLPWHYQSGDDATFELDFSENGALTIKATSKRYPDTFASVRLDPNGTLGNFVFSGYF